MKMEVRNCRKIKNTINKETGGPYLEKIIVGKENDRMKYGKIQGVELPVSKIIFGCAIEPMMKGEDVSELLDAAVKCGINTFDTARVYGLSEKSLGAWAEKRKNRNQIVIETKGGHPDEQGRRIQAKALEEDIETSFEMLRTTYIDIYLLHRDDPNVEVGEIIEILNQYARNHRIRAFGGSNWTAQRIKEANQYAAEHNLQGFSVSSPHFGLARQCTDLWGGGCTTITGDDMAEERKWYREEQMPIFAYSSLARGLMAGRIKSNRLEEGRKMLDQFTINGYWSEDNLERLRRAERVAKEKQCTVAQLAVAWMFTQGLDVYAILSSNHVNRLISNTEAMGVEITEEEARWLNLG